MRAIRHSVLAVSVFSLGAAASALSHAASISFIGGADNTDNGWSNAANWSPSVPGAGDDVTVDPSLNGVVVQSGDDVTVNSLQLDGGLNVNDGGKLTVLTGIVNNGVGGAYTVNDGVIVVDNGGTRGTITNTYSDNADADPDNDYYGYFANTRSVTANLDNSGSVVNGGDENAPGPIIWIGDVINRSGGYLSNNGARWEGDVTSNSSGIYNSNGSAWVGDVVTNDADIANEGGSSWTGDILANDGSINNVEASVWVGDVVTNSNSINNDGGTWQGDVLANTGTIFSTSLWTGNMTSSGELWLSGRVEGNIDNDGGVVHVVAPLAGVLAFTNTGTLDMGDGAANDRFSAQSWSGTGTAILDFAPGLGRSDRVVLSGDYSGDTTIDLLMVGPAGRGLGDIALFSVGGANTGLLTVNGLPEDGVISYRLVDSGNGWSIATELSDAPLHVASAIAAMGRSVAALADVTPDAGCAAGSWARPLGGGDAGTLGASQWQTGMAGAALGHDFDCVALPNGTTFRAGIALGALSGSLSQTTGSGTLDGAFNQGFASVYGDLVAGSLEAVLRGRLGVSRLQLRDPGARLDAATLSSFSYDIESSARYALELGAATLTPEIGLALSGTTSRSTDFGDVGGMRLTSAPVLDAHLGVTLSGELDIPGDGPTLRPFASVALHSETGAGTAQFAPDAGGTANLSVPNAGTYVALSAGLDVLQVPSVSGTTLAAGLKASADYGPNIARGGVGGYARVSF